MIKKEVKMMNRFALIYSKARHMFEDLKSGFNLYRNTKEKYDMRGSVHKKQLTLKAINIFRKNIEALTEFAYKNNEFMAAEMCEEILKQASAPRFTWIDKFKDETYYDKFEKVLQDVENALDDYSKLVK